MVSKFMEAAMQIRLLLTLLSWPVQCRRQFIFLSAGTNIGYTKWILESLKMYSLVEIFTVVCFLLFFVLGGTQVPNRKEIWDSKRVFFLTPQIMVNDLSRGICPAGEIKCLVIDEAHRALGNYAYCQVMGE